MLFQSISVFVQKNLGCFCEKNTAGKDCKPCEFFSGIQLNLNGHDRVYHLHIERMLITAGLRLYKAFQESTYCLGWDQLEAGQCRGVNAPPRLRDGLQWLAIDSRAGAGMAYNGKVWQASVGIEGNLNLRQSLRHKDHKLFALAAALLSRGKANSLQ